MGCGASQSHIVFTDDNIGGPETSWFKVCQTLDVPKGKTNNNKLVIKRAGWKTIRIFVSSTFKDLHHEREVLVKEVFPDLRAWCEQRRLHLVDVDLRWGVPKDTTTEGTLRTCLGEIDRCYQDNVMPFFLNMTSERIGWIPLEKEVTPILVEQYRWVFGLSVTEMEIVHGAYRKDNPNSLFMMRDGSFLKNVPNDKKKTFVDERTDIAPEKLKILRKMISDRFPPSRVVKYSCVFDGLSDKGKPTLKVNESFKTVIFDFFKSRIEEQYPMPDTDIDKYQNMKESHEAFMKNRAENVLGRDAMLDKMKSYVDTGGSDVPLVILGEPGTGKSSLMSKATDIAETLSREKGKWHVFYHFVGAVPGSTDLELALQRLLKELGIVTDRTMPKDLQSASQLCLSVLSNTHTKPVIVFFDALNQLDEDLEAVNCCWVPKKLSPSVRCVFSMIAGTAPHKALMKREPKPQELLISPLTIIDRKNIAVTVLGKFNKKLDQDQILLLLNNSSSENPLWLSIALEELRVYGEFRTLTDKVDSLAPGLLELLGQVLERFELEAGGDLVVATLCLIEVSARGLLEAELLQILADEENLMPPRVDEEKDTRERSEKQEKSLKHARLPAFKWSAIYRALRTFLRPYGDSGDGRLDFYHRSLSKAVRKKYFGEGNNQADNEDAKKRYRWWHRKLADFFWRTDNVERKVEELPYHLIKLDEKQELADCLVDLRIFDELYNVEFSSKLLSYWNSAAGSDVSTLVSSRYLEVIRNLENEGTDETQLCFRYIRIANFFTQVGILKGALELANKAKTLEEEVLGNRPESMGKILDLTFKCHDETTKLNEFIYMSQKPLQWKVVTTGQKCVEIRKTLSGKAHKLELAHTMTRVAFAMNTWMTMGGSEDLSVLETAQISFGYIDTAIETFKEANDLGHLAEAIMTKAVLTDNRESSSEQRRLYEEAHELCTQVYGEYSVLAARCQINTGIHYEECGDYTKAYRYFKRYGEVTEEVFGPDHPKAVRGKNILNEPMYKRLHTEETNNQNS